MTWIVVDATTLISLGSIGELRLLKNFTGERVVLPAVKSEVDTEPARSNLEQFLARGETLAVPWEYEPELSRAKSVLGESERNGDVEIVAAVLAVRDSEETVGVVSDDRRLRNTTEAFGAIVTGTLGVVVRAVEEGMKAEAGIKLIDRLDTRGLHLTGELRKRAESMVREAASDS